MLPSGVKNVKAIKIQERKVIIILYNIIIVYYNYYYYYFNIQEGGWLDEVELISVPFELILIKIELVTTFRSPCDVVPLNMSCCVPTFIQEI